MKQSIFIFLLLLPLSAFSQTTEVKPVDNRKALLNPNMGWNLAYYTDDGNHYGTRLKKGDVLDWFPGCNIVSFRIGWARIEKQDGIFDWSYTDSISKYWIEQGKQVGFCWINFTTGAQSAPLWLKDLGVKGWTSPEDNIWMPLWDDPIMLNRLERFIAEAAKRYNGKPEVAFVEVGSLGIWGEGHTLQIKDYPIKYPIVTDSAALLHLNLWRKYFNKTQLFINDDLIIDPFNKGYDCAVDPYDHTALINWMMNNNCGLSDWSILVSNRSLYWSTQLYMERVWRNQPTLIEHEHYGYSMSRNVWGEGKLLLEAVEKYHASHVRIHWWPDEFLNGNGKDLPGNKELINAINLRLGYRFQVTSFSYPAKIKKGKIFTANIKIRNAGVAPCYKGGYIAVSLLDKSGKVICSMVDQTTNVKDLMPAESVEKAQEHAISISLNPPKNTSPGNYHIAVSIGDERGNPLYRLPYDNDIQKQYIMGEIKIE
jgi:hypothetical protein